MKNKLQKIIPYGLILIAVFSSVGFFGSVENIYASPQNPNETCQYDDWPDNHNRGIPLNRPCQPDTNHGGTATPVTVVPPPGVTLCTDSIGTTPVGCQPTPQQSAEYACRTVPVTDGARQSCINQTLQALNNGATPGAVAETTYLERLLNKNCGLNPISQGCILKLIYFFFYGIPAFLLWLTAGFFNFLIYITLGSGLYAKAFVPQAWGVVRDLSNLFFILILLYIAIKTILGLGGSDVKKMIVQVIIMALLINFSMFMTKVVIDTSNILALVFYNKIDTCTKNAAGECRPYDSVAGDKDIAGGMVKAFDPTTLLTPEFLTAAGTNVVYGRVVVDEVPFFLLLGIILLTGSIMFVAAWAFFISGFSFLGRLVELWVLIIFSPFAFMSSAIPILSHIEYIGWDSWLKRLFKVAFMAPIFMFFLYFIFLLIQINPFSGVMEPNQGKLETIFLILIPALLIIKLLLKATEFAEKGSGEVGDKLASFGKLAAGLAIGGSIGAVAAGLQGTAGHVGKRVFENTRMADWETNTDKGLMGWTKRRLGSAARTTGGAAATGSFDLRQGVVGTALKATSAATGLNLGAQSKFLLKESGGYEADLKRRDEKRKKRAEGLKIKEGEDEKQRLNQMKEEHQTVSLGNEMDIHEIDEKIKSAQGRRETLKEVANSAINKDKNPDGTYQDPTYAKKLEEYQKASDNVKLLQQERKDIKEGGYDEKNKRYRTHNRKITQDEVGRADLEAKAAENAKTTADALAAAAPAAHAAAVATKAAADAAKALADAEVLRAAGAARLGPSGDPALATAVAAANAVKATADTASTEADKNVASATSAISTTAAAAIAAATKASEAATKANLANTAALGGTGNSQNKYEDDLIPKAEHKLKEVNDERRLNFAKNVQNSFFWPWNEAARKKSVHEIRMGVKPEKSRGGGHGVGGHLAGDIIAAGIAEKVVGGGKAPATPAADKH